MNGGIFDSEKLDEEEELIVDSDKSDRFPLMYTALSPTLPIEQPLVTGHKTLYYRTVHALVTGHV